MMIKQFVSRIIIFFSALCAGALPIVAYATEDGCSGESGPVPITLGVSIGGISQVSGLPEYINIAYRYLSSVSLVVAIVMVVYGGFLYLVGSAGMSSVQRGKQIMKDAIIGMLIILGAYSILNTVNPKTAVLSLNPSSVQCVGYSYQGSSECNSDAECPRGRCVEVDTEFRPEEASLSDALAGAGIGIVTPMPGAAAAGAAYGFYSSMNVPIKKCSDGSNGSPCGEDEHCASRQCVEAQHVCIPISGNRNGTPCENDSNCTSDNCESVSDNYKFCRGNVEVLTTEAYISNGYRIPDNYICFERSDCNGAGVRCAGPAGRASKFCQSERSTDIREGQLCFLGDSIISPLECAGSSEANTGPGGEGSLTARYRYTCLVCPSSGTRNWERLTPSNDPDRVRLGSCRNWADIGRSCGR